MFAYRHKMAGQYHHKTEIKSKLEINQKLQKIWEKSCIVARLTLELYGYKDY